MPKNVHAGQIVANGIFLISRNYRIEFNLGQIALFNLPVEYRERKFLNHSSDLLLFKHGMTFALYN